MCAVNQWNESWVPKKGQVLGWELIKSKGWSMDECSPRI